MWHIDAEIISLAFMLVIMADIIKTNTVKVLKDKLFVAIAAVTICAIISDIISSAAMVSYHTASWWFTQITLLLYFVLTPMLSMLWQLYAIAVVNRAARIKTSYLLINVIPYIAYLMVVLSNPYTGWMFQLSAVNEYARGALFNVIFIVFYGYSLATLILACVNFKKTERTTSIVLSTFPIIAGLGVIMQELWSGYLITGSAFTLILLITYMFLQNRKATRDNLTGLNNRMSFSIAVERLTKGREHGYILVAALDDFKLFNQIFGQKTGDMLLCKIAEYFISISPSKTAYRYGGDIFTLILRRADEQAALKLANTIMDRFKESFYIENIEYTVSTCLGVVEYQDKATDKNDSIISAMDFAIYQAKKRERGQITFFNEALVNQFKRRHEIVSALTSAIENQSFEVYIQPIYHIEKRQFLFGEALLRLNDPALGNIPAAEFVPIAEETGQIVEITYCVLEKVCAFLKENRKIMQDKVSISVNFSVIQFMQNDMVEKVKTIIENYGVSPKLIKIEITESIIADSFDDIKTAMKGLNEYGITFALDDYGQGYSNISYLINLPFTFVKLDKSIIDNVVADSTFISALIPMFKSLNKTIISEGVEEKAQADILTKLSCDAIQGYYFARPMPMGESLALFEDCM
ncbi:MAG: EAL domain-containing protein [Clostridia bacterium]